MFFKKEKLIGIVKVSLIDVLKNDLGILSVCLNFYDSCLFICLLNSICATKIPINIEEAS